MYTLAPHQVDLWYMPIQELPESRYRHLLSALPQEEQTQHEAFHFPKDRLRYLLTRTMIRQLLADYLSLGAENLEFNANSYGRPCLLPQQNPFALDFNLAHNEAYIVCALLCNGQVGVDIEGYTQSRQIRIAEDFFTTQEVSQLLQQAEYDRNKRFVEFWTLKEAFIKAVGKGMAIPLNAFYFRFPEAGQLTFVDLEGHGGYQPWHFQVLEGPGKQIVSLAATFNADPAPSLSLRVRAFELEGTLSMNAVGWHAYRKGN